MTSRKPKPDNTKLIQYRIIEDLGVKEFIDPLREIESRITFLKEFLLNSNCKGFVLGISGGQDSALAGRLAQLAVESLRASTGDPSYKFVAIRLPYGEQKDEIDAQIALDFIQPDESIIYNIKPAVDAFKETFDAMGISELSDFAKGNVKARTRMMTQYAYAGEHKLLVIGTDHAAEAVTGFFTKFGDGAADILPISGLTKGQGKELLAALDAPESIYTKVPTADLLDNNSGRADEDELGVKYSDIDAYLTGKDIDPSVRDSIALRYQITAHKRHQPVTPGEFPWWKPATS